MATPRPAGGSEAGTWRQIAWLAKVLPGGLPAGFRAGIESYLTELARWRQVVSMTGYESRASQLRHLVLESLLLLRALPPGREGPVLDIGTGAGAPGLILKLARPEWTVELVEANRRRANFLRQALRQGAVGDAVVHHERAEELARREEHRGRYGIVTLRAVARPAAAVALALPFLGTEGVGLMPVGQGDLGQEHGTVQRVRIPRQGSAEVLDRRVLVFRGTPGSVPRGTLPAAGVVRDPAESGCPDAPGAFHVEHGGAPWG